MKFTQSARNQTGWRDIVPNDRTRITNLDIRADGIPEDYVLTISGGEPAWLPLTATVSGEASSEHTKLIWTGA